MITVSIISYPCLHACLPSIAIEHRCLLLQFFLCKPSFHQPTCLNENRITLAKDILHNFIIHSIGYSFSWKVHNVCWRESSITSNRPHRCHTCIHISWKLQVLLRLETTKKSRLRWSIQGSFNHWRVDWFVKDKPRWVSAISSEGVSLRGWCNPSSFLGSLIHLVWEHCLLYVWWILQLLEVWQLSKVTLRWWSYLWVLLSWLVKLLLLLLHVTLFRLGYL